MTKLVLSMDGLVLKEIGLDKERVTIGRRPSNDIQIDNLAISGEHAAVVTILNDSFLEDLNSTNGTLVNGQPIKKHFLRNNDVVELGKYKLKYIAETARTDPVYERDLPLQMETPLSPQMQEAAQQNLEKTSALPAGASSSPVFSFIQVLNGGKAGQQLKLTKELTSLGKPGRQVAVIARRAEGYFITHVEGTKFPSINGQMIDAQTRLLKDHDVIDIGGIKMEFFLKG